MRERDPTPSLPIDDVLPTILAALARDGQAVLQAPPGAGKTTRVPLALLQSGRIKGRILMLEPRRLATRAAAERMAETLGPTIGQSVGYRIRGESRSSRATRIEVVTEGILTRMIQSDPELSGIGAVIFDEFHERSLQADLGLALSLEIREALRPDLYLLVMSATLDAQPVADLMGGAPVVTSQSRNFPVQSRWLVRPWARPGERGIRFEVAMRDLILQAVADTEGGLLAFLPGEGEIRRVEGLLRGKLPPDVSVHALFGAMPFARQRAAIAPARSGRKLVLASAIAETSLTIEGVRVVIDGGRARRARFDPASGMSRLVTERVSRAEATQRQGRAGRVAPGVCYKLWTKGEEGGLAAFAPPEIAAADLAPLVLESALWGARSPGDLPFLTPPAAPAVNNAVSLLKALGALDEAGHITAHGRALAALPVHPRLGHMVLKGGRQAPLVAAILGARDILSATGRRAPADLALRVMAAQNPGRFEAEHPYSVNRAALAKIRDDARRLPAAKGESPSLGVLAALAYPDRVGLRRKGTAPRYILSGGKGACLADDDPLGTEQMIVATDLDGDRREARIRLAVPLSEDDLRRAFPDAISRRWICRWSAREKQVEARDQEVFGALVLDDRPWRDCPQQRIAVAMVEGLRDLGLEALTLGKTAKALIGRVEWARARGAALPDFSPDGLMGSLEEWLLPYLGTCRKPADLASVDLSAALKSRLDWAQKETLQQMAPAEIRAPTGTRLPIDYSGEAPRVSVRLQELFGLDRHPVIGPDRVPLVIELLSPARRAVQLTSDLPGFWRSSYAEVRKDMRGRYPRHPWPEDPTKAQATRRAKPHSGKTAR